MNRDDEHPAIHVIATLMMLGILALGHAWFGINACDSRWPDREHEWGFFSGCMVKGENGIFLPEDRIRFVTEE